MIKHLTLIRHAKSSWENASLSDYERSLNERGRRDAPRMGEALQQRGIRFDRVLCSSAKRARETLSLLRERLEIEDHSIRYLDDLYCASTTILIDIIRQQDNDKNNIAIVAHNPGIEDLAAMLSNDKQIFVTCSVMQIEFKIENWKQVAKVTGKQKLFLSPKTI
ncbi:Phosphohistidine phosphatase SixA [hydrothermal vent metagenome]|uniref:Phosphohistidine phosphatase SixA n=1 Tax=hydrothermal vent metagenome TaxID=652676 RepID=A0A3B1BFS0_9ZZZZ